MLYPSLPSSSLKAENCQAVPPQNDERHGNYDLPRVVYTWRGENHFPKNRWRNGIHARYITVGLSKIIENDSVKWQRVVMNRDNMGHFLFNGFEQAGVVIKESEK